MSGKSGILLNFAAGVTYLAVGLISPGMRLIDMYNDAFNDTAIWRYWKHMIPNFPRNLIKAGKLTKKHEMISFSIGSLLSTLD